MRSVQAFRAPPWQVLFAICLAVRWCTAGPADLDGALQDLKDLNLTQAQLVAGNATLKCSLTPNLCGWQLHLYEGHSFSAPLLPTVQSTATQADTAPVRESFVPTPPVRESFVPTPPVQESFVLMPPGSGPQFFIEAEVEPKPRRESFVLTPPARESFLLTPPGTGPQLLIEAEVEPKPRREVRRRGKLVPRTSFNYSSKRKLILLVFQ